jgi:hypothetical protein
MAYPNHDQREHPRYSYKEVATLPFSTIYASNSTKAIHAQILDVSQGGVALRGEQSVKENQVVRCTLSLPGVPVRVPTLMRVRWSRKVRHGYLIGLQFLI